MRRRTPGRKGDRLIEFLTGIRVIVRLIGIFIWVPFYLTVLRLSEARPPVKKNPRHYRRRSSSLREIIRFGRKKSLRMLCDRFVHGYLWMSRLNMVMKFFKC